MKKVLKQQAAFSALTDDEFESFIPLAKKIRFMENELVFDKNHFDHCFFIVESGEFLLHLNTRETMILKKGSLFGEIGVINERMRAGIVRAREPSDALVFNKTDLLNPELLPPQTALKIFLGLAKNITNYLGNRNHISTRTLIETGETEHVEFKSTLRRNLYTEKYDKAIEHSALKTIAAFLNSKGGTLLVGVKDDRTLLGLKNDNFPNNDKMLLHLNALIRDHISQIHTEFVSASIESLDDKRVLRIDCEPATYPTYLSASDKEYFYVRTGPATTNLNVSKIVEYVNKRFIK